MRLVGDASEADNVDVGASPRNFASFRGRDTPPCMTGPYLDRLWRRYEEIDRRGFAAQRFEPSIPHILDSAGRE
jgi:hypothetical protein